MPAAKNAEHSPLTTFCYNFEDLVDFYIYKSTGKSAIQRYSAQRYIIPSLVILSSHVKLKKKNIFSIFYGPFPLPPHSHSSYQTLQYLTVQTFPLSFDLTASYFLPLFSFASNTCLELLPFDNVNRYKFRTFGKSRQSFNGWGMQTRGTWFNITFLWLSEAACFPTCTSSPPGSVLKSWKIPWNFYF